MNQRSMEKSENKEQGNNSSVGMKNIGKVEKDNEEEGKKTFYVMSKDENATKPHEEELDEKEISTGKKSGVVQTKSDEEEIKSRGKLKPETHSKTEGRVHKEGNVLNKTKIIELKAAHVASELEVGKQTVTCEKDCQEVAVQEIKCNKDTEQAMQLLDGCCVDNKEHADEGILNQEETNKEAKNQKNAKPEIELENQEYIEEELENQENTGEELEAQENAEEKLRAKPLEDVDQRTDFHEDVKKETESHKNVVQGTKYPKDIRIEAENMTSLVKGVEPSKDEPEHEKAQYQTDAFHDRKEMEVEAEKTNNAKEKLEDNIEHEPEEEDNIEHEAEEEETEYDSSMKQHNKEETEERENQEQCDKLDESSPVDLDLGIDQELSQDICNRELQKSPILGKRTIKVYVTSNKIKNEEPCTSHKMQDSFALVNREEEKNPFAFTSEDSMQSHGSNNEEDDKHVEFIREGTESSLSHYRGDGKNMVDTSSDEDKLRWSPSPEPENEIPVILDGKDAQKSGNIVITSAGRSAGDHGIKVEQSSEAFEQQHKGKHPGPSVRRDKIKPQTPEEDIDDPSPENVEYIDITSDNDEDTSAASEKEFTSKSLYHYQKSTHEKIVPTVCCKCKNIWNDEVLNMISLGTESVTVNSRITYGAIICINNWAESHFSTGKEEAVRSLLDRADLGKNIGSLKISEVNHWLGSIMKAGKIKCCDVFAAVYRPDTSEKFLSSLMDSRVMTDKNSPGIKNRIAPVANNDDSPVMKMNQNDLVGEKPKKTMNADCSQPQKGKLSLKKSLPSCSKSLSAVSEDSEPVSEKILLSGAWDTPMFAEKKDDVSKEDKDECLETKKKSISDCNLELDSKSQVETTQEHAVQSVVESLSIKSKPCPSKEVAQSTSEENLSSLSKETTPYVSRRISLSLPKKPLPASEKSVSPRATTPTLPASKEVTSPIPEDDVPSVLVPPSEKQTSPVPEKVPPCDLSSTKTSSSEKIESPMSDNTTLTECKTVTSSGSEESTQIPPVKQSKQDDGDIPEVKTPKLSRSRNKKKRKKIAPSTRQTRSSSSSTQKPPLSQDASDPLDISLQQNVHTPTDSTLNADNLTQQTLKTSHEESSSINDKDYFTHHDEQAQVVSLPVVSSTRSKLRSVVQSQNSSWACADNVDENSISSDTNVSTEGEEKESVQDEENSSSNLCTVLGLNVSSLDTYCSSTDMKIITNGRMTKKPSKRYKYSFSHYAMLKERSALSGLAKEAFDLLPFESDNCRPLAPGSRSRERFLTNRELLMLQNICILNPEVPDVGLLYRILIQILLTRYRVLLVPSSRALLVLAENVRREFNRAKSKGTHGVFLSQDWDANNVYTAEDLWLSKLKLPEEPTVRNIVSVFCLWKNLEQHIPNLSLPEAIQDLCRNISLGAIDKTKLCVKLYTRFCSYLYEEKNSSLAEFFLNQPFTGSNFPMSRKVLMNAMVASYSTTNLSSTESFHVAEKEVQDAVQKCVAAEKVALQSPADSQKKEGLRVNVAMFKEKLNRYNEVNHLMLKRIRVAEKRKQEVLTRFEDSKSRKLVQKVSETRKAIHQVLAKRRGENIVENVENSKKALKLDNSKGIYSSVEICSKEKFSGVAASIDLGEDVSQTVREGIYELLASGVDVHQVKFVIHTIMTKLGGEEAPSLPSVSWIRNFARLNGFKIKSGCE